MMTWLFGGLLALMVLAAAALVARPLLRARSVSARPSSRTANVAVYRRRLTELEADLAAGTLSRERFDEARAEVDRALLEDTEGPGEVADARPARSPVTAVVSVVVVPVLAVGLYLMLGNPGAVVPPPAVPQTMGGARAFVAENLEALESRVETSPDDAEAWKMLGTAYLVLERAGDAARAFAEAVRAGGEQPALLVQQARALALANGGRFGADASELLRRVLELEPDHPRALWFTGLAAAQRGEPEAAREAWNHLLALAPPGSSVTGMIEDAIAGLGLPVAGGQQPAVADAAVNVQVTLPEELREGLSPDTTVFVLARAADGPPAPLAVQRLTVADLPAMIRLDDSMAMRPGLALSNFERVEIVARVSHSGNARPAPGDIEGSVGPVAVGREGPPVQVAINRRL